MKLAIVVDSSCGLTKKQVDKLGWHFLPLYIKINDEDYKDGVDLTFENFTKKFKDNSNIFTSFTPVQESKILFKELSKKYDHIIVYPISSELSSQYNNLQALVIQEKLEKVNIINSKNICFSLLDSILKVKDKIENDKISIKEAIEILNNPSIYNHIEPFLIPKTTDSLLRGGRLSPSAARVAKLLKIVPIIKFSDETGTLDKYSKGRIFSRTFLNLFKEKYEEHLKLSNSKNKLYFLYFDVECSETREFIDKIKEITKNDSNFVFLKSNIPPIVAVHTGLESVAFQFSWNSEGLKKLLDKVEE